MNKLSKYTLKALHKVYAKVFHVKPLPKPECEQDPDKVSQIIYDKLNENKPCMIARFGSTELATMVNYIGVKSSTKNPIIYIQNKSLPWWWNESMFMQMQNWSGFFPPTQEKIEQFCRLMLKDSEEVDILGSWLSEELFLENELKSLEKKVFLEALNPYFVNAPWTKVLKGKKVLVVHPFSELIQQQYETKRTELFKNKDVLPEFELQTIKAVQSLGGKHEQFQDWFEALEWMKNEIDKRDYDICLIGAGAYGFPLAAHIKRSGKKAVHMGGSLQLLFGIRGKRWENQNYNESYNYASLMNDYWVKPLQKDRPKNADKVENACYW